MMCEYGRLSVSALMNLSVDEVGRDRRRKAVDLDGNGVTQLVVCLFWGYLRNGDAHCQFRKL